MKRPVKLTAPVAFAALLLFVLTLPASAQNFMTVTSQSTYGTGGQLLPSGQISFQPVDNQGRPISYQAGGGGQQISFPTVCSISNGAIRQPCQVANVSLTNPINVCFSVTIKDSSNRVILGGDTSGYTCVQPQTSNFWCATGTCNFDQYVPNLPAAVTALIGPPRSNQLGSIYAGDCPSGQGVIGYATTGRPDCAPSGGSGGGLVDPGSNGVLKRTAFNITGVATTADINAALGYTAANDALVSHLSGTETFTGSKSFSSPIVGSITGNSGTATNLAGTPSLCPAGQAPLGILPNGNATGCFPFTAGLADPGSNGLLKRTSLNTTAIALSADVIAAIGFTPANDTAVAHLSGAETIGGSKTFTSTIVGSITGNSGTSNALLGTPTLCPSGQAAQGVLANGNATGCLSLTAGLGDPGANGVIKRTSFNTTAPAVAADINTTLGYTAANNALVGHLAGVETFTGAKTFSGGIAGSLTGNASTSSALDHVPTPCSVGNAPIGIVANGNSTGCAPLGIADPGSNGLIKRTSLNVTAPAVAVDVNTALGYTAANDSLVLHLAGTETVAGSKTFNNPITAVGGIIVGAETNRTGNYRSLSPAGNASPASTLILDASSGFLQIQADSGAGANQGGTLNLQSSNGPNAAPSASLLVGSSGIQIDANGLTIFTAGGLKTILTGPGITQFGSVGGTRGQPTYVGNTSGSVLAGCADANCTSFAITGAPLALSSPLGTLYGGLGFTDTTFSGNTHKLATVIGTITNGGCAQFDSLGNLTSLLVGCGTGSGGLADPGANGLLKRTSLNVTAVAGGSDINSTLGYTPANDTLAAHLAGTETFTGSKTFSSTITGSISGNAGTATALATTPTLCGAGLLPKGIVASGNATGCAVPPAVGPIGSVQLASAGGLLTNDSNTTIASGLLKTLSYGFTSDPNYSVTMALATSINFTITQVVVAGSGCTTPPCVTFSVSTPTNPLSWSTGDRFQAAALPAAPTNLTALNGHDFVIESKAQGTPTSTITISYSSGIANGTYASTSPGVLNQYAYVFNGNTVVFNRLCSSTNGCPAFGSIRLSSSGPSQADRLTMNDPNLPGGFIALSRALVGPSGRVQLGDTNTNGGVYIPGPAEFVVAPTFDVPAIGSITGNSATATALAADPADCSTNSAATGISASGVAQGCFAPVLVANDLGGTAAAPQVIATHLAGFSANQLPRLTGTGGLVPSSLTDDLTTVSVSASGGLTYTGGAGHAGFDGLGIGTPYAAVSGIIALMGPTSGGGYNPVLPAIAQSGFLKFSTTISPSGCTASSTILCGTFNLIDLASSDVGSSVLGATNGGTGSPFVQFAGPSGTIRTWTGPNANATLLTSAAPVTPAQGGTGLTTGNPGGILYYSSNSVLASSATLATGLPLIGGGSGGSPATGTISGTGTKFVTTVGALVSGNCVKWDVNFNAVDAGTVCGGGGGGGVGTGVVPRLAYYDTTSTVASAANTAFGDGSAAAVLALTGTSLTQPSLFVNCTTPVNNCVSMQVGGVTKLGVDTAGNTLLGGSIRTPNNAVYQSVTSTSSNTYAAGIDSNANQGGATLRGGNATGTGNFAAGPVLIQPGALTNAAPGATATEGTLVLNDIVVRKGTTVTVGNLACGGTTDFTAADCVTAGGNVRYIGIWNSIAGGSAYVQQAGTLILNLDASSTWTAWDTVCTSTTGAALVHMNGTTACNGTTALRVGYAVAAGTSATVVTAVLRFAPN